MSKSGGWGPDKGAKLPGPLYTKRRPEGKRKEFRTTVPYASWRTHPYYFQDFIGTYASLPPDVSARTTQTAGTPTAAKVADDPDGTVAGTLDATSEVQVAGFDWGDQRVIPANKSPFFQALVKVSGVTTNQSAIIGLMSDYNATFDSVTVNAWFRMDGSLALLAETDDNVTNTDDQATGVTIVAAEYNLFTIDTYKMPGRALFYVNDNMVADLPWTAPPATTLQPIVAIRKSTGTTVPAITLDVWAAEWLRSSLPG